MANFIRQIHLLFCQSVELIAQVLGGSPLHGVGGQA